MTLSTVEIKAFVPAADFAVSKQFYVDLGFEVPWSDNELAYVRHGETSFLLQNFNEPTFIKNYQMHLMVEDVNAAYLVDTLDLEFDLVPKACCNPQDLSFEPSW